MKTANRTKYSTLGTVLAAAVLLSFPVAHSAAQDTNTTANTNAESAKIVRSSAGRTTERGDAATRDRSTMIESETLTVERVRRSAKSDSRTAARCD